MKREISGTLWVVVTLVAVVVAVCTVVCLIGLTTYEITGQTQ